MGKSHVNADAYGFAHIGGYSHKNFYTFELCSVTEHKLLSHRQRNWARMAQLKTTEPFSIHSNECKCVVVQDELTDERSPVVKFKGVILSALQKLRLAAVALHWSRNMFSLLHQRSFYKYKK